jgi:hypothetical protein
MQKLKKFISVLYVWICKKKVTYQSGSEHAAIAGFEKDVVIPGLYIQNQE